MQRNPHSYQIATGYRTFNSLSLIYQPITKKRLFFTKNNLKSFFRPGWKGMGDPGVEEVETRIFVKPERGCGAVYLPCLRRFYALFLIIIQWNTCFFNHGFGEVALTKLR